MALKYEPNQKVLLLSFQRACGDCEQVAAAKEIGLILINWK